MRSKRSIWKRGLAVCLMAVLGFMFSATPLYQSQVQAAEVNSGKEYIKELRLFITQKNNSLNEAEKWCAEQGNGWQVFEGEDPQGKVASKIATNLNIGTEGPGSINSCAVYLCYRTTTDPKEAITDIAVINEKGGYSEGEYEMLLKKQKETYIDMVKNMKTMIGEYRANYEKKTPMAVKSHDFLNIYKEDDSGELLGDILLAADDDKLAEILLQCNGTVVLTMQEKLAAACDTAKTTWLDRMVKLGSFDKLKAAFSKNMTGGDINKALENQYKESANTILDHWDDLSTRINSLANILEENGLSDASADKIKEWVEGLKVTDPAYASCQDLMLLASLANYQYGDKTLLDFFAKTKAQVENDGIETLYPMAACLTKGQISALDESVGLYQMVQDAYAASIVNNNNAGIMAEIKKDDAGKEAANDVKDSIGIVDEMIKNLGEKKVSIYEGVDREVFKGGVAVTTEAKNASAGTEDKWTDIFVKNGDIQLAPVVAGASAVVTGILSGVFAYAASHAKDSVTEAMSEMKAFSVIQNPRGRQNINELFQKTTVDFIRNPQNKIVDYQALALKAEEGDLAAKAALEDLGSHVEEKVIVNPKRAVYNKLKIGFAVFTVLLSAADIALTVYSLYQYYNVEHLPIPHHMVHRTYSETKEASYVAYKSVRDQDGNCGDLNANNARQWLALYYTKDKKAGDPILAPSSNNEWVYKTGSSNLPGTGYTPLHMFGTDNVAQNLTFADGDNGYSYNDGKNGIYLFFSHANAVISYSGKNDEATKTESPSADSSEADVVSGSVAGTDQTGTTISGGVIVLVGAMCLFAGGFIGFLTGSRRRKKQI